MADPQTNAEQRKYILGATGATYFRTMNAGGAAQGFKQCLTGIRVALELGVPAEEIQRALFWPPSRAGDGDDRLVYLGMAAALVELVVLAVDE